LPNGQIWTPGKCYIYDKVVRAPSSIEKPCIVRNNGIIFVGVSSLIIDVNILYEVQILKVDFVKLN